MANVRFPMELSRPAKCLTVIYGAPIVVGLCVAFLGGIRFGRLMEAWAALALPGTCLALFLLLIPQSYEFQVNGLLIRRGVRKSMIDYGSITAAKVLTFRESIYSVEIGTRDGESILVAPRDERGFLDELIKRSPNCGA
jgi:hypothetical protein